MKSWGIYLIIFGIAAIALPKFGYQLKILSWMENPLVGGSIFIAIGAVLTLLGIKAEKK